MNWGVSLRTVYRDIAVLQGQGAPIDGEAGVGYVLKPGYLLPPLMFTEEEIEALVLGARWVAARRDSGLGPASENALAKISGVLPPDMRAKLDATGLIVIPGDRADSDETLLTAVREALRREHKLRILYRDQYDARTERTIWPFALGYFDRVLLIVAWCEKRQDFRSFRADRLLGATYLDTPYPRSRHSLHREWQNRYGLAD